MANDFSNRIGARSSGLTTRDRPTPDDIDELRRRQEEHAKRTREAPKKNFDRYLADQGGDASDKESSQSEPEEPQETPQVNKDVQSARADETHRPKGDRPKGSLVAKPKLPPMSGGRGRIIRG